MKKYRSLPFSKVEGLPFTISVFKRYARKIMHQFAPDGLDLIRLGMSLDDLDNIHERAPKYSTQFGITIKHVPTEYWELTLQFLTFDVSRERLEICYGEAMPGDHWTRSYIAYPDGTEIRDLDIVCDIEAFFDNVSVAGSYPNFEAHGSLNLRDSW